MTHKTLMAVSDVAALIQSGRTLLLAGDESLLSQLPPGNWIGGTSANFMAPEGGVETRAEIFVTDISEIGGQVRVKTYTPATLSKIGADYPKNGFVSLILPGMSGIHGQFAQEVQSYDGVFNAPLVGWIAGVPVSDIGKTAPKVFAGSGAPLGDEGAAMIVELPDDVLANVDIVNLFTQGDGATILFSQDGFSTQGDCLIDGRPGNLARYIAENGIDTKLPLVADYNGAMINVSVQSVDAGAGSVAFYAPVFKGMAYRFAKPVPNYVEAFNAAVAEREQGGIIFSCNCILNFLYAELLNKKTGQLVGPITFGEIAYMLLNQTLVYLTVKKK